MSDNLTVAEEMIQRTHYLASMEHRDEHNLPDDARVSTAVVYGYAKLRLLPTLNAQLVMAGAKVSLHDFELATDDQTRLPVVVFAASGPQQPEIEAAMKALGMGG